jgi:sulfotransferase family protein
MAVVWIASYPKSGNTWLRFMLASYLTKGPITSVRSVNSLIPVVGGMVSNRGGLPVGRRDPLLVKTHALPSASAVQPFRDSTRKAVYLVRNPRDIILSLIRHSGAPPGSGQARGMAKNFIAHRGMPLLNTQLEFGNWPDNVRAWTEPAAVRQYFPGIDVLPVRYEDMRADPVSGLGQVLDFLSLGGPAAPDDVEQAVANTSLDKMRALEAQETNGAPAGQRNPFGSRGQFVGQGLHNQSLTGLGTDVEDEYQQLFRDAGDFACCAHQFGYQG